MTDDDEQAASPWGGSRGNAWVALQDVLDGFLAPMGDLLVDGAPVGSGDRVLDVGCGAGSTTLALAQRVGPGGQAVGVDVSEPMVVAARGHAERTGSSAVFLLADAQRHAFEPASFDLVGSRFGVMFFDDPAAAFANLHAATRPGGRLRFVVWRGEDENPFLNTAGPAAAPLLDVPAMPLDGPGPCSLRDRERTLALLADAGWSDVDAVAHDLPCVMPEAALIPYVTGVGMLALALAAAEADDATRAAVGQHVRPAFDRWIVGDEVHVTAAVWLLTATA